MASLEQLGKGLGTLGVGLGQMAQNRAAKESASLDDLREQSRIRLAAELRGDIVEQEHKFAQDRATTATGRATLLAEASAAAKLQIAQMNLTAEEKKDLRTEVSKTEAQLRLALDDMEEAFRDRIQDGLIDEGTPAYQNEQADLIENQMGAIKNHVASLHRKGAPGYQPETEAELSRLYRDWMQKEDADHFANIAFTSGSLEPIGPQQAPPSPAAAEPLTRAGIDAVTPQQPAFQDAGASNEASAEDLMASVMGERKDSKSTALGGDIIPAQQAGAQAPTPTVPDPEGYVRPPYSEIGAPGTGPYPPPAEMDPLRHRQGAGSISGGIQQAAGASGDVIRAGVGQVKKGITALEDRASRSKAWNQEARDKQIPPENWRAYEDREQAKVDAGLRDPPSESGSRGTSGSSGSSGSSGYSGSSGTSY